MLKGKSKKIIAFLLALIILATVLMLSSCKLKLPNFPTTGSESEEGKLATPQNVSFNEDTNEVSWEGVENATGYLLWVNGNTYEIGAGDLSKKIVLFEEKNEFKVKAIGDGEEFTDSNWSLSLVYTMTVQAEESLYNKVNIKLAEVASEKGFVFKSIIGFSYVDVKPGNNLQNLTFETLCYKKLIIKGETLVNVSFMFKGNESLQICEMIEEFNNIEYAGYRYQETVSYKSAESLLKSGSYDGKMQELKNHGYQITVLDSVVREGYENGSAFTFNIVGTYKATKAGADDVYFSSINRVDILDPSRNEEANYTTFLEYEQLGLRTVTETKYVLHEKSTTLDYILDWEQKSVEAGVSTN